MPISLINAVSEMCTCHPYPKAAWASFTGLRVRPTFQDSPYPTALTCRPPSAVGSFVAPLVCQSIVATGIRWANFYFGSLVLSALNAGFVVYAFTI